MNEEKVEEGGAENALQLAGESLESLTILIQETWKNVETDMRVIGGWLMQIRDNKLWHPKYSSFKEYCDKELPFGKRRANQVIEAERLMLELPAQGNNCSLNEGQLRELAKVPAGKRAEVLAKAMDLADREGKALTARHIMMAGLEFRLAAKSLLGDAGRLDAAKMASARSGLDRAWASASHEARMNFLTDIYFKGYFDRLKKRLSNVRVLEAAE